MRTEIKRDIGGYFELETSPQKNYLHEDLLALNTARNSFEYILLARGYFHVYVPYFTCNVMLEPIERLGLSYSFYDVDDNLEPVFDYDEIQDDESFLITNYFGIKGSFIRNIAGKIPNLIVDNAQALFDKPLPETDTIYSPRKFVGVADGGYVSTTAQLPTDIETDQSSERMSHLLKRADLGAEAGYRDFQVNDASLQNQPIKKMSALTRKILGGLDYPFIAEKRRNNYEFLDKKLGERNLLKLKSDITAVPMVYPYRTRNAQAIREKLLANRIFCATYWPNVKGWCTGNENSYHLSNEIVAIPIDQRYGIEEMKFILEHV